MSLCDIPGLTLPKSILVCVVCFVAVNTVCKHLQGTAPERAPLSQDRPASLCQFNNSEWERLGDIPAADSGALQRGTVLKTSQPLVVSLCGGRRQLSSACRRTWQRRPLWRLTRRRAKAVPATLASRTGAGMSLSSGNIPSQPGPFPGCLTRTPEQTC